MDDLRELGVRDRTELTDMVAVAVGDPEAYVIDVGIEDVPYDLEALTTQSRQRVRGRAQTRAGPRPFSIFVKVLRSWQHHPAFGSVPPEHRAVALAGLPWEVEPDVYRSDLRAALPSGLTMPRTYAVIDLDATHVALWIEDIAHRPQPWTPAAVAAAAHRLGRFAARSDVAEALHPLRSWFAARDVRSYVEGRLTVQLLPLLRGDALWHHPAAARHFGPLRARTEAAADRLPALLAELEALPTGMSHGDACPRNLLHRDDELVMIDFGFTTRAPLGLDLVQLITAETMLGERPAADVPALIEAAVPAFTAGLAAEGDRTPAADVERAFTRWGLIFTGFAAIPFERFTEDPAPDGALDRLCRQRAEVLEILLDRAQPEQEIRPRDSATAAAAS